MVETTRTVRIYVCSPLRDLQAERACLHETVFPAVAARCQRRGIRLEVVDPRWSARSAGEAEGAEALAQALDAIDRCRPFFLGILGEHYGNVLERIPEDVARVRPSLVNFARSSRIHLEMLHGVLVDPQEAPSSFFYFRKPDFLKEVPEAERATYSPDNPLAARKLHTLKATIRACGRPVRDYGCRWDAAAKRVASLEEFSRLVLADLLGALGESVPETAAPPTPVVAPGRPAPPAAPVAAAPPPKPTPAAPTPAVPPRRSPVRAPGFAPPPAPAVAPPAPAVAPPAPAVAPPAAPPVAAAPPRPAPPARPPARPPAQGDSDVHLRKPPTADKRPPDVDMMAEALESGVDLVGKTGKPAAPSSDVDLDKLFSEIDAESSAVDLGASQPAVDDAVDLAGPPEVDAESSAIDLGAPPRETAEPATGARAAKPVYLDENVQFTAYHPKAIRPAQWYNLLAFAHLSERRPGAPAEEPDPVEEVRRQAESILGEKVKDYEALKQHSRHAVPSEGQITFVPEVAGVEFNPPRISFLWQESVHRAEFRLRASKELNGKTARGQLTVFLGSIILADIPLALRVDGAHKDAAKAPPQTSSARPYRKIFASYSHADTAIVQQFERLARTLGDEYLRDWVHLRAGEDWDERLLRLIEEADVFQLFWSWQAMQSPYVRREWMHALSLKRPHFVRPTYWEDPLPELPKQNMPPDELRRLHFQRIDVAAEAGAEETDIAEEAVAVAAEEDDADSEGVVAVDDEADIAVEEEADFAAFPARSRRRRDDDDVEDAEEEVVLGKSGGRRPATRGRRGKASGKGLSLVVWVLLAVAALLGVLFLIPATRNALLNLFR